MKELNIGGQVVRIRANPLASIYYKQEFKRTILSDFMTFAKGLVNLEQLNTGIDIENIQNIDLSGLDDVVLLQMVWAMNKADSAFTSAPTPSYESWVASLESFDITDAEMLQDIMTEIKNGFFRGGGAKFAPKR